MSELRAVTIAHTGRGNAGHGLHRAFEDNPRVRMVALADPDMTGRAELAAECDADRTYGDYREMLACERPDIAVVARHWFDDNRVEEVLDAIECGVRGVYLEKPVAAWPDQARAICAAADGAGVHVVLAHRSREHPTLQMIRDCLGRSEWGPLTRIRAMDKGDHRVGVEEAMIHAPHAFDAMLFVVGEAPVQVAATVLQNGRFATRADAVGRTENGAGPIAGDRITATYIFPGGSIGTFESVPVGDGSYGSRRLGTDFYFQHAVVTARNQPAGEFQMFPRGEVMPTDHQLGWSVLKAQETWAPNGIDPMLWSNQLHGRELVRLVEGGDIRSTTCSVHDATVGVEMLVGAYRSHLEGRAIRLPLEDPGNPWTE